MMLGLALMLVLSAFLCFTELLSDRARWQGTFARWGVGLMMGLVLLLIVALLAFHFIRGAK